MGNVEKLSYKTRCINFLEIVLLYITLPTWDCVSDLYISIYAIYHTHYWWGFSLLAPVLLNTCFTVYAWIRFDTPEEKRWSWLFLLLLVWPQWRCCKLLLSIVWRGEESGLKEKEKHKRDIGCLEPFLEAAPQVLIKTAILAQKRDEEKFDLIGQLWDGGQSLTFQLSYIVSLVGTGLAMVKFLKSGPCRIMKGGKGGVAPFILTFISTFGTLGVKVALLKLMSLRTLGDETIKRVAIWAACCIFPQFLVATISLSRAFRSFGDVSILLKFPELLAAPLFNPVTFGRVLDLEENRGKVSFSLRWTFVNIVVTVCGIAALAVYMGLSKEIEWSWYVLTLLMVMCIAMVWMVPLMVASKYPGNILSVMYQRGVLDLRYPARQFVLKWDKEEEKEEVVVDGAGSLFEDKLLREFGGKLNTRL